MVRSFSIMSVAVFAATCGASCHPIGPVPPSPLAGVPIKAWPKQVAKEPAWRASGKPAYVVITVGGSDAAAIVWVTPNGSDLVAAYCVDREQLDDMRTQIVRERGSHHDGFMELKVQPDKHTDICSSSTRPHPAEPPAPPAPPEPPAPPAEPTALTEVGAVHCPSATATCNFVMPHPQQTGPGGEPPMPDIVWKLDQVLWDKHVFVNRIATQTGGRG